MNYQLVCRIKTLSLQWNPAKFSFQWTTWELCLFQAGRQLRMDEGIMDGCTDHYFTTGTEVPAVIL